MYIYIYIFLKKQNLDSRFFGIIFSCFNQENNVINNNINIDSKYYE